MRLKACQVSFPFLGGFSCKTQEAQATTDGVLWKKLLLKISQNPQENNCVGVSFSKENLTQVLSCEFCKNFKNNLFIKFAPDSAADFKRKDTLSNLLFRVFQRNTKFHSVS